MIDEKKFKDFIIKIKLSEDKCIVFSEKFECLSLVIYESIKGNKIEFKNLKDFYKLENLIDIYKISKNNYLYNYLTNLSEVNKDLTLNTIKDLTFNSHFYMINIVDQYKNKNRIEHIYIDYTDSYIEIDFNFETFKYSISYLGETIFFNSLEECFSIRKGIIKEKITETGNLRLVEMLIF